MLLLVARQLVKQLRRSRFAVIFEVFRELRAASRRLALDGEGVGIALRKVADRGCAGHGRLLLKLFRSPAYAGFVAK